MIILLECMQNDPRIYQVFFSTLNSHERPLDGDKSYKLCNRILPKKETIITFLVVHVF